MKLMCKYCGCHFKKDFKQSLECGYWKRIGLEEVSRKNKRSIWTWLFKMPHDKVYTEDSVVMAYTLYGEKKDSNENFFEKNVRGYKKWSDEKRQDFQRDFFKYTGEVNHYEVLLKNYIYTKGKK